MRTIIRSALALSLGASGAAAAAPPTNFNIEHTNYTAGRGNRTIATTDAVVAMAEDTKLILTFSGGERRAAGERTRAARFNGTVRQDWSNRLSTQTSVALATNGEIFARSQFAQDISYKLGDSLVATVGGKYATYAGGDHVTSWSAGGAYYVRGLSATYRYSLIDSRRLGRSDAHLASLRLKDPGGSGSTQLWLGHGTSLYDVVPQADLKAGKFTSVALRREQPLTRNVSLTAGLSQSWFTAPTGNYRARGLSIGVAFRNPQI
jgi:YaiO family outer membrane protein